MSLEKTYSKEISR